MWSCQIARLFDFNYVLNRYFGPLVSSRIAADIRKRSIVEGTFGTFVANEGGWDPSWDEPKKMYMLRPAKGHIRERNREQRYTWLHL
jgi:hypothetical protein